MAEKEASKIAASFRTRCLVTGCNGDMPTRMINSQASAILRIALLILSAAVFAWGLQYKLSLYQTGSHSHPLSVAKLMQGEQTNKKITSIQAKSRRWLPQLTLDHTIYAFRPPVITRWNRRVDEMVYPAILFVPCSLFIRPPPSL
jgi:hypothetical protein